jgi:hypothetical protein
MNAQDTNGKTTHLIDETWLRQSTSAPKGWECGQRDVTAEIPLDNYSVGETASRFDSAMVALWPKRI